jgi:hypothetical protein
VEAWLLHEGTMSENATPPSAGEVRALAHQLLSWADQLTARPPARSTLSEDEKHDLVLGLAEATRHAAQLRLRVFPGTPFACPVWDVMLDLFIREMNGFRVSLDHLSLEGDTPAAAVYRAVEILAERGLVERAQDRFDARVVWLSLSGKGKQGMTELLLQAAEFVRPYAAGVGQAAKQADAG